MVPVEAILILLSPLFFLFIGYEWYQSVRRGSRIYQWRDTLANFVTAAMHQAGDVLSLLLLLPLFYWLHQFALFDLSFNALNLVLLFVLQDFFYYWFHRVSHRVRWLWASHVAHHSSRLMNYSTAFRQSLTYPLSGMWLFWVPLMLLGFDPKLVLAVVAINLGFQFFVHTRSGKHWGWLGLVFNTPAWHRVHHACNEIYIDKNFAGVLVMILSNSYDGPELIAANGDVGTVEQIIQTETHKKRGESMTEEELQKELTESFLSLRDFKPKHTFENPFADIIDYNYQVHVRLRRTDEIVVIEPIIRNFISHTEPPLEHQPHPRFPRNPQGKPTKVSINNESVWVNGQIRYFPLRLAWYTTTHKSQGLTFDTMQVDISHRFFASPAMAYTAISRCRSASGLYIVGNPTKLVMQIRTSPDITTYL